MKRLVLPLLLVLASLVVATIFTTVTAVALASYTPENPYVKENKNATIVVDNQLTSNSRPAVQ